MKIKIQFYSYFKDLTGCAEMDLDLPANSRIADALEILFKQFPKFAQMRKSMLIAVGVDYQKPDYILHDGDQLSFFPPVQGG